VANVKVQVRRAYEDPGAGRRHSGAGRRIWPRGLTKARAALDEWCKEIAPPAELRKWHGHDPERFGDFGRRRYQGGNWPSLNVPAHWRTCGSLRRAGE